MGNPQLWNGRPLIVTGKPAVAENCCCEGEEEGCGPCIVGSAPNQFQVVLAGIVSGGGCYKCEILNGTFVLDWFSGPTVLGECRYRYLLDDTPCACIYNGVVWLQVGPGGGFRVDASCDLACYFPPCSHIVFYKDYWAEEAVEINCLDLTDEDIPFSSNVGGHCDASAATCRVTSL